MDLLTLCQCSRASYRNPERTRCLEAYIILDDSNVPGSDSFHLSLSLIFNPATIYTFTTIGEVKRIKQIRTIQTCGNTMGSGTFFGSFICCWSLHDYCLFGCYGYVRFGLPGLQSLQRSKRQRRDWVGRLCLHVDKPDCKLDWFLV